MATSDGQFNANTDQAEADALATKSAGQGNNKVRTTLEGNLQTSQGASTTVGVDSNNENFNSVAPDTHGALKKDYTIERTIQGDQALEEVPYDQQRGRFGWSAEQSANERGNNAQPEVTAEARSQYEIPTTPVSKSTAEWQNNGADNLIPNVGSRFMR